MKFNLDIPDTIVDNYEMSQRDRGTPEFERGLTLKNRLHTLIIRELQIEVANILRRDIELNINRDRNNLKEIK